MTTQDLIQHLEQTQRDAAESKPIEEISSEALDQISGAGGGWFANATWNKAL